jgi:hypothetical protein
MTLTLSPLQTRKRVTNTLWMEDNQRIWTYQDPERAPVTLYS